MRDIVDVQVGGGQRPLHRPGWAAERAVRLQDDAVLSEQLHAASLWEWSALYHSAQLLGSKELLPVVRACSVMDSYGSRRNISSS